MCLFSVIGCRNIVIHSRFAMVHKILGDKSSKLFIILATFFVANALIAECIGGKLLSLEKVFGMEPHPFSLLGQSGLTYTLSCGVLLWPLEFIMTDIVNEYFGLKAVRRISYIAVALISYAFFMFYAAISAPPDTAFWTTSQASEGIPDMQAAFSGIFGQGMWIIAGSITAFLVSQLVDVWVFHKIKQMTGERMVWLRATGSTIVSQLVDSFVVLFIAFKLGRDWSYQRVIALALISYSYKATVALLLTPVLYFVEGIIDRYLGADTAAQMKKDAMAPGN